MNVIMQQAETARKVAEIAAQVDELKAEAKKQHMLAERYRQLGDRTNAKVCGLVIQECYFKAQKLEEEAYELADQFAENLNKIMQ